MKINKKISVVVPIYNTEKYLKKCLDSLINQTYKNIEIIIVNDGSKGNADEVVNSYIKKGYPIKYLIHETNKGLFQARLTGAKEATGDYIAFFDSDDHITVDYYRSLMYKANETGADIVCGKVVMETPDEYKFEQNLCKFDFDELNNEECLDKYFHQEGLNFQWHTIWNKLYSKELWDQAYPNYLKVNKHLIMAEDFAFSTVLFYYAKKVTIAPEAVYFYYQSTIAWTSSVNVTYSKYEKNIGDLVISFSFVESFLKDKKSYNKYKENFLSWKNLYVRIWTTNIETCNLNSNEKKKLFKILSQLSSEFKHASSNDNFFYSVSTKWNDKYEEIKNKMINSKIKCVSFDVFDTLICRPFFEPRDLFKLMNDYFRKVIKSNTLLEFSEIRVQCEKEVREEIKKEEITLDEIYQYMSIKYEIPKEQINKIKEKEVENEIRFCTRRNSTFSLYELCLYLDKKVIFTSDIYLPKEVIEAILEKCGYKEYDNLYVSSETKVTKWTGNMFKYVLTDLNLKPSELIHIGDNWESDKINSSKKGIIGIHYPSSKNVFLGYESSVPTNNCSKIFCQSLPEWRDNRSSMTFLGIRCMLALAMNKYFDNPFISFNEQSDFNADPYFIGYYALGMHIFALTKWLLEDSIQNGYESMSFMARDGYLPRRIWNILKSYYKNVPKDNYLPISRKSILFLLIEKPIDLYKLSYIINIFRHTGKQILEYLENIINIDMQNIEKIYLKEGINVNKKFKNKTEYDKFIKVTIKNFYNSKKNSNYKKAMKDYFNGFFEGKSAVFDIGYSGRPETVLSNFCNKRLDTYFIHLNTDEGYNNALLGKYKLNLFYDFKPGYTGVIRETFISELGPSCISYKKLEDKIVPIYENYDCSYQEEYIINQIQKGSIDFVNDLLNTFKKDIFKLHYLNYYASIPFEMYLHSSKHLDRIIFSAINFEDSIGASDSLNILEDWTEKLVMHNQIPMDALYGLKCEMPGAINLTNKSKLSRFHYYLFFDRTYLKKRVKEKIKNPFILNSLIFSFRVLRKTKNTIKKIASKIKLKK